MYATSTRSASEQPLTAEPLQSAPDLPKIWIQPHYKSFNGIRALAVLLVFFTHYGQYWMPANVVGKGWVGVDLFFVLSGFLITGILFDSVHDPRFFHNFYVRRALRIFPIFYAFFLIIFLLTPILHLSYPRSILFYFFYLGNLYIPFVDVARANPTVINWAFHGHHLNVNIGHLWSLCVEEQFYLVWPSVVWLVRSRKRLMHVCVCGCVAVLIERFLLAHYLKNDILLRWSTFTRIDTLLVGAWFALWLRGRALSRSQLHRLAAILFWVPLFVDVVIRSRLNDIHSIRFEESAGFTLIALAGAGVVLYSLDDTTLFARLLRTRGLYSLGAISYGFYFIHHLYMYEFESLTHTQPVVLRFSWLIPIVAFVLSCVLALLSFRFLESPFLRLKSRLAPQWTPLASAPTVGNETHVEHAVPLHVPEPRPD